MTNSFQNENILTDYINTFAYFHVNNQKIAAVNLWANGFRVLYGATIVKEFETYKNVQFTDTNPPDFKTLMPFINDSLMDDTRVITCFENFLKGILILNNCVVHKLTNRNKALKQEQHERPIMISEVFTPLSFSSFQATRPDLWETDFQTLNFSWMLKPKYQEIANLPIEIVSILKDINEERNKLHFISVSEFKFGDSTIQKYSKIIEFANTTIVKCMLDLDSNMKEMIEKMKSQ